MFFFSSRRRHTRFDCDWSSDVCSSDLGRPAGQRPVDRAWRGRRDRRELRPADHRDRRTRRRARLGTHDRTRPADRLLAADRPRSAVGTGEGRAPPVVRARRRRTRRPGPPAAHPQLHRRRGTGTRPGADPRRHRRPGQPARRGRPRGAGTRYVRTARAARVGDRGTADPGVRQARRLDAVPADLGADRAVPAGPDGAPVTGAPIRRPVRRPLRGGLRRLAVATALGTVLLCGALATGAAPASATTPAAAVPAAAPDHVVTAPAAPAVPAAPTPPVGPAGSKTGSGSATAGVQINGADGKPSSSIVILLAMTVLSVAPALLLRCTSFTKIFVVLSIVRNALGLTTVPPNPGLAGLALFLSLFIMGPVMSDVNKDGVQPYLHGQKTQSAAVHDGAAPPRTLTAKHTRNNAIALCTTAAKKTKPKTPNAEIAATQRPAFVLSELRAAFIIGFVVYIPFLLIDMVVSASLMSMGMMMLPPVTVSMPFKLLLFVLVNGWGLVVTALVASY